MQPINITAIAELQYFCTSNLALQYVGTPLKQKLLRFLKLSLSANNGCSDSIYVLNKPNILLGKKNVNNSTARIFDMLDNLKSVDLVIEVHF